jgi:hypothetical protein
MMCIDGPPAGLMVPFARPAGNSLLPSWRVLVSESSRQCVGGVAIEAVSAAVAATSSTDASCQEGVVASILSGANL